MDMLERITKWRRVLMNWQLGARMKGDPEADAVVDHRELSILLRVEATALAALLIQKGVFTAVEYTAQCHVEAEALEKEYQEKFPGYRSVDDGMVVDLPEGLLTIKRLGLNR